MRTMEVFRQFIFATVFFVTCVSVHWNFVGKDAHRNLSMSQQQQHLQQSQKVDIDVMEEKLALSQASKTAKL